jgi:hypothetical protein
MNPFDYSFPVSKLLTQGDCRHQLAWPNYLALGLGIEHIPELIRMALDEALHQSLSDSLQVWAPIHAWRTLGQLRAEDAVVPLCQLFARIDEYHDDWLIEDLPLALAMIGPAALPPLANYIADRSHGLWARTAAIKSIKEIGRQHPDTRLECINILSNQLAQFAHDESSFNAFLISRLLDLHAIEAASVIEQAFAANAVDLSIVGDWEDAQIELGLLQNRRTIRPRFNWFSNMFSTRESTQADNPHKPQQQQLPLKRQGKQASRLRKKRNNKRRKR